MFVRRGISSVFRATHNGLPLRGLHTKPLEELKRLGVELPETPSSPPSFVNCVRRGNRLYVSGHLPVDRDGNMIKGKVGKDVTTEQAAEAAKLCAINMISTIKAHVDNLDGIRVTKLFGLVNCVDGYTDHPTVINGCSDFFNEVFGKVKGAHARSAIGTNSLPFNVPVEIEAIFDFDDYPASDKLNRW